MNAFDSPKERGREIDPARRTGRRRVRRAELQQSNGIRDRRRLKNREGKCGADGDITCRPVALQQLAVSAGHSHFTTVCGGYARSPARNDGDVEQQLPMGREFTFIERQIDRPSCKEIVDASLSIQD